MKAVRINEFGGTEVLKIQEIERPVPAADEILIKVYASGVNPADWVIREGGNDFLKPILKLPLILGWDVAGIVEDVGSNVTDFKKGDEVYGIPNFPGDGSYAEYVIAKASQLALKSKSQGMNALTGNVARNTCQRTARQWAKSAILHYRNRKRLTTRNDSAIVISRYKITLQR
jgi:NADPH:quinone reductase-like Zn-dependent oxidoreductase